MPDRLTGAVRKAILGAPHSMRALARASGVPVSTLSKIANEALGASPETAARVRDALRGWSRASDAGVRAIDAALRRTKRGG